MRSPQIFSLIQHNSIVLSAVNICIGKLPSKAQTVKLDEITVQAEICINIVAKKFLYNFLLLLIFKATTMIVWYCATCNEAMHDT